MARGGGEGRRVCTFSSEITCTGNFHGNLLHTTNGWVAVGGRGKRGVSRPHFFFFFFPKTTSILGLSIPTFPLTFPFLHPFLVTSPYV